MHEMRRRGETLSSSSISQAIEEAAEQMPAVIDDYSMEEEKWAARDQMKAAHEGPDEMTSSYRREMRLQSNAHFHSHLIIRSQSSNNRRAGNVNLTTRHAVRCYALQ